MATGSSGNIVVAKVTSMVVLGGSAFIVTLIPVLIGKRLNRNGQVRKKNPHEDFILTLFLAFGGGVLLCTTFLHLLPEVSENIEDMQKQGKIPEKFPLPLPEFIMCCGFFIMYIVEEFVHKYLHSRHKKAARLALQGHENPLHSSTVSIDSEPNLTESYKEALKQDSFKVAFSPPHEEDVKIIPSENVKSYGSRSEVNHNQENCSGKSHVDHDHQPNDHHHAVVSDKLPSLRELLIVLALTIHEGFEGIAIGLESSAATTWYLMSAVAVHKCVIAFCIGVELVSGQIRLKLSIFYAFIYSCASPLGIGVGLLLTTQGGSDVTSILSVVLQGVATGTLLYVVFFEILKREQGGGGLAQMAVVILGFACMALVTSFLEA